MAETLDSTTAAMKGKIERYAMNNLAAKFNMAIHVIFEQEKDETIITEPAVVFVTEQFEVYSDNELDSILQTCSEQLQNRITAFEGLGSGWVVREILSLDTTVWKLCPLRGESYHPLSKWIQNTHCVVNVKNEGNECFRDSVMASLYTPAHHVSRPGSYKKFYEEDDAPTFTSTTLPMKLRDISKFEKENEDKSITVHVYAVHEWRDRKKGIKRYRVPGEPDLTVSSEPTMSDGESESEPEDKPTEEDQAFLDEMYQKMENDTRAHRPSHPSPQVRPLNLKMIA